MSPRSEAKAAGLRTYFTGHPCVHGHVTERFTSDGRCRECARLQCKRSYDANPAAAVARVNRWSKANRPKANASRRIRRAAAPGKAAAKLREWHARNPGKAAEYAKRYYAKAAPAMKARVKLWISNNREKHQSFTKKWRGNNPDACMSHVRNRRARVRNVGGEHSAADIKEIFDAQRGLCAYCHESLKRTKRHVDHIMPVALGGENGRANLQLLCEPCNLQKGAKHPLDYARQIGLLV